MNSHQTSRRKTSALLLCAVVMAVTVSQFTACRLSDIPGLALPRTPVDTITPAPPFSPQTWMNENTASIRSVNFNDTDFSDLDALRAAIGDSRVVLLGEQSSYDGTTFLAKSRLVRFLHEQMGFDVLVFESGIFDLKTAWERIESGANSTLTARASIDPVWSNSTQLEPLFEYIASRAHTSRPLALGGIDPRFTGTGADGTSAGFASALFDFLDRYDSPLLSDPAWPAFFDVSDRIARQWYDSVQSTGAERAAFQAVIDKLHAEMNRLVNIAPPSDGAFWITMSLALHAQSRSLWLRESNRVVEAAAIRDSSMANSLIWLAQSHYAGKKLIVWSTATRIMRSSNELYNSRGEAEGHGRALFGHISRVTLGDVIYSLGFLAGSGAYGPLDPPASVPIRPVVAPLPESWDGLFFATQKPFAFLHLRRVPSSENAWIFGRRISRAIGYQQLSANWPAVYDGFFFTAAMEPAARAP